MGVFFILKSTAPTPPPEPVGGLYKLNDSTPLTVTLDPADMLVDGIITEQGAPIFAWYQYRSAGIDMDSSVELNGLTVYHKLTGLVQQTDWLATYHFGLYISNDNANWTYIEEFTNPTLTFPQIPLAVFTVTFSVAQTARYFKLRCMDAGIPRTAPSNYQLYPTEIEVQ